MSKLPFVIWMLGFPLVSAITEHLEFMQTGEQPTEDVAVNSLMIAIWVVVGALVYHTGD